MTGPGYDIVVSVRYNAFGQQLLGVRVEPEGAATPEEVREHLRLLFCEGCAASEGHSKTV